MRLETFRYQHSFAPAQAAHFLAGALLRGPPAALALLSFELEYSGRRQWLRRLLPAGEGTNVVARLPARGRHTRTLVIVAHHDAAHTGWMWDPRLLASGDARAARTHARPSFALLPELAFLLRALTPNRLGSAVLGLAAALALQSSRAPTVPGANDNATGVAGVLALVEQLAAERPEGLDVLVVIPGCEESGMGGMAAWLEPRRRALDPARTLVVGLDTIGSGTPIVVTAEGGLWPVRYREEEVGLAERVAGRAGLPLLRWRIGGWTDPALARLAGLPAISLLSVRDGGFPNYHRLTDTPDEVDFACVETCVELAAQIGVWHTRSG